MVRPGLPSLVAVHGRRRSGKGTIADYLNASHAYVTVKFADPLKDMLRLLLLRAGVPHDLVEACIEGNLKECPVGVLGGRSTRFAMQTIGTEWRDLIATDLYLRIAIRRIRDLTAAGRRVVVDDLRFPFELDLLETEKADLWMVTNSRADSIAQASADPAAMARLAAGDGFLFTQDTAKEMLGVLLKYCGVSESMMPRCLDGDLRDAPIAMLGGKSGRFSLQSLLVEWKGMMDRGPAASSAATSSHSSEQILDSTRFSAVLSNEGSFQELYVKIEAVLADGNTAVAA